MKRLALFLPLLALAAAPARARGSRDEPPNAVAALDPARVRAIAFCAQEGDPDEAADDAMRACCRVEDPGAIAEACRLLRFCRTNGPARARAATGPLGRQAFLDASNRVFAVTETWLDAGSVAIVPGEGWSLSEDGRLERDDARAPSPDADGAACWTTSSRFAGTVLDRMRASGAEAVGRFDARYAEIGGLDAVLFPPDACAGGNAPDAVRRLLAESEAQEDEDAEARGRLKLLVLPEVRLRDVPFRKACREIEGLVRAKSGRETFRIRVDRRALFAASDPLADAWPGNAPTIRDRLVRAAKGESEREPRVSLLVRDVSALDTLELLADMAGLSVRFDASGAQFAARRSPDPEADRASPSPAETVDVRRRVLETLGSTPLPATEIVAADTAELATGLHAAFLWRAAAPGKDRDLQFVFDAPPEPVERGKRRTGGSILVFGSPLPGEKPEKVWAHDFAADSLAEETFKRDHENAPATALAGGPSFRAVLDDFAGAFGLKWYVRVDLDPLDGAYGSVVFVPAASEPHAESAEGAESGSPAGGAGERSEPEGVPHAESAENAE